MLVRRVLSGAEEVNCALERLGMKYWRSQWM